ncbi:MAG: rhodanese-like domain-containing protein [Gammaproteobacteria bacterium]|nr:rhodanese-like domain-containing protein [Gammaproteobacteria bacterium]
MDQLLEFVDNHWMLCSAFFVLLSVFIRYEMSRGGKGVHCQEAVNLINHENAIVLDVRPTKEFNKGHITDSINIPHNLLAERFVELDKYKEQPIILVCAQGHTTGASGQLLRKQGWENLYRLTGGITAWEEQRLPLAN